MTNITISREDGSTKGRYVARVDGIAEEGELTFTKVNPKLIIADHTFAPDAMRGLGVAKALVERLIADARAGEYRIIPLCPYVKAQYSKHPEWADVMQG
jgi:predicted GNAT family acetyltransferase